MLQAIDLIPTLKLRRQDPGRDAMTSPCHARGLLLSVLLRSPVSGVLPALKTD